MWAVCAHTHCCAVDHMCSGGNNFYGFGTFRNLVKTGGGVAGVSQNQLRETEAPNTILLTV